LRVGGRLGEDLLVSLTVVTNVVLLDVDDLGCDVDALVAERASERVC
jgi:hypothetical protein